LIQVDCAGSQFIRQRIAILRWTAFYHIRDKHILPLITGASLLLVDDDISLDSEKLVSLIMSEKITFIQATVGLQQRILQTLAGTMSVALENARLFDETQKRAAEMATVNAVSQQLAGKLDLDALITLVGDEIRRVFDSDIAFVALLDRASGMIEFPYQYGEDVTPLKLGEGITSRVITSGKPLVINEDTARKSEELGARIGGNNIAVTLAADQYSAPFVVGGAIGDGGNPAESGTSGGGSGGPSQSGSAKWWWASTKS